MKKIKVKDYLHLTEQEFMDFLCNGIANDLLPKDLAVNKVLDEFRKLKAKENPTVEYFITNDTLTIKPKHNIC